MEMLQGVWKQHLRPRAVVGYGVKIFPPSPPNYVTRSPGSELLMLKLLEQGHGLVRNSSLFSKVNALVDPVTTYGAGPSIQVKSKFLWPFLKLIGCSLQEEPVE